MTRWPLPARLVLMGAAGIATGLLLSRLPWWAAGVVFAGGLTWAVVQFVRVHRDMRRIKDELAELERQMKKEAGG